MNWRPVDGKDDYATNSLAVIITHMASAEHFWISEVVGHRPETRDRDAEFATVATNAQEIIRFPGMTALKRSEVLSAFTDSDLSGIRRAGGSTRPMRCCVRQVMDHAALHLDQMQITCQLWSGDGSGPSPLWFERLPPKPGFLV